MNNMKIKVWTVLWTTIRKARNHCQDVDNCGDEDQGTKNDNFGKGSTC